LATTLAEDRAATKKVMQEITNDPAIKKWMLNFDRPTTNQVNLKRFTWFVKWARENKKFYMPNEFLELARRDGELAHDTAKEHRSYKIKNNYALVTANNIYGSIRSFLVHNGVRLGRSPRGFSGGVTYETDRLLTQKEVRSMYTHAKGTRDKCIVVTLAQSGQREEVLHALMLRHVKEVFTKTKGPYMVKIPAVHLDSKGQNCNKTGKKYRFCIGEDASSAIRLMIDERKRDGEHIDDDSWLFRNYSRVYQFNKSGKLAVVKAKKSEKGEPLAPEVINEVIVKAAEATGIQSYVTTKKGQKKAEVHGHLLRDYWKHQMKMGGNKDQALLKYMMGQTIEYGGTYDTFTDEDLRTAYVKAEPYLSIEFEGTGQEIVKGAFKRFAEEIGLDVKDEQPMEDTISEIAKVYSAAKEDLAKRSRNGRQKVVKEDELDKYLEEGWELVDVLPSGKLVIKQVT